VGARLGRGIDQLADLRQVTGLYFDDVARGVPRDARLSPFFGVAVVGGQVVAERLDVGPGAQHLPQLRQHGIQLLGVLRRRGLTRRGLRHDAQVQLRLVGLGVDRRFSPDAYRRSIRFVA